MTDEEILDEYNKMVDHFGSMPHPEHEPKRFAYYVKIYRYYHEQKKKL